MSPNTRDLSWFGKLPCVGDFCSHNMSAYLLNSLDSWLSSIFQQGEEKHGTAWMTAYFQTPVHGFLMNEKTLPALEGRSAVGLIMPSVDKAGRAFPFVLIEQFANPAPEVSIDDALPQWILQWFLQAHALCANALSEDWTLEKLSSELNIERATPPSFSPAGAENGGTKDHTDKRMSHWYRIEFSGAIQCVYQCNGLPDLPAFETLLGLNPAT